MYFQCTFAATSATIVSGAIAERCNFNGYIIFSVLMTGVVYPIHTHWAWGGGWLAETYLLLLVLYYSSLTSLIARDFHDFAGSAVVHLSGGAVALVGALMLGPRIGRFTAKVIRLVQIFYFLPIKFSDKGQGRDVGSLHPSGQSGRFYSHLWLLRLQWWLSGLNHQ